MLESFLAFNMNAVSNFLYALTTNMWFSLIMIGVVGSIILYLKEAVDTSVREEQNII